MEDALSIFFFLELSYLFGCNILIIKKLIILHLIIYKMKQLFSVLNFTK